MRLSPHFDDSEFACPCCGVVIALPELVAALEELREIHGVPIHINSGFRCEAHNVEVGGVKNSQHLRGAAADIVVKGVPPEHVAQSCELIRAFKKGGVGSYSTFTHVDVRGHRARWKG